jgi:tetratricopeptide (TPR) repeat protein
MKKNKDSKENTAVGAVIVKESTKGASKVDKNAEEKVYESKKAPSKEPAKASVKEKNEAKESKDESKEEVKASNKKDIEEKSKDEQKKDNKELDKESEEEVKQTTKDEQIKGNEGELKKNEVEENKSNAEESAKAAIESKEEQKTSDNKESKEELKEKSEVKEEVKNEQEESPNDENAYLRWTIEKCKEILRGDPKNTKALYRKGVIEFNLNQLPESQETLTKCREVDRNFHKIKVAEYLGDIHFELNNDWSQAASEYNRALETANEDKVQGRLHMKIGMTYEMAKKFSDAINSYMKSSELIQDSAKPEFKLGLLYLRLNDKAKGVAHLRKALSIEPNNVEILRKLAEALSKDNDTLDEAIKCLKKALELEPKDIEALIHLSRVYERKGELELAIETLENAKKDNASIHYYLGKLYFKEENYINSIANLKECLRLEENHLNACLHLATLMVKTKNPEAGKYFERALSIDPNNINANFGYAKWLHMNSEDPTPAFEYYHKVLSLNPNHYKAMCQLGIIYLSKGDYDRAAEYLKQSLRQNPKYVTALYSMGNLLFEIGNPKNAIKYHRQALQFNHKEVQALLGLANALCETGETKEAIRHYK